MSKPQSDLRSYYASAKAAYLKTHPLCESPNCWHKATEVDHQVAKGLGGTRQDDLHGEKNYRALCQPCHMRRHGLNTGTK